MCPTTIEEPTRPVRISWCQAEERNLVQLDQDLPTSLRGAARAEELKRRWNQANPTLPSTVAALRMQLSRIRSRSRAQDQGPDLDDQGKQIVKEDD